MNTVQLLSSAQIDKKKWDACVRTHANGMIYARTFYLDHSCDHWSGIVIGDYQSLLPIPWRKKFGIRYAYVPPFIQQLGLIGETKKTDGKALLHAIGSFVSFGDFHFNYTNERMLSSIAYTAKTNYCMDLSAGHTAISNNYRASLKEILLKTDASGLTYATAGDADVIALHREKYAGRTPHVLSKDYANLLKLCSSMAQTRACQSREVKDQQGRTLAMILLLKDEKRVYNLLNPSTEEGKRIGANHWLLDQVLKEFAGSSLLFDFEGSELPGVKRFYEKFNPDLQPYFHYHHNQLIWPLRLLKR